jgi:hypothetical protein
MVRVNLLIVGDHRDSGVGLETMVAHFFIFIYLTTFGHFLVQSINNLL